MSPFTSRLLPAAAFVALFSGLPTALEAQAASHASHRPVAAQPARAAAAPATGASIEDRTRTGTPAADSAVIGTLLLAHGGEAEWNAEVERIARTARTGGPLELAFLMGPAAATHRFQDQVARLVAAGATQVVIVPLLVSSHSGHYEQIRYLAGLTDSLDDMMQHHLHMGGLERPSVRVPMHVTRALDDAPELAGVLAERANALATDRADRALFLVAHGPNSAEDHAEWMRNLRVVAARVRELTGFRDVRTEMVRDDAPAPVRAEGVLRVRELIGLQQQVTGKPVIVVPVLVSKGRVNREKFRADLAGLDIVYEGTPLLPHPLLATWIERRVNEARSAAGIAEARAEAKGREGR